jgi:hypothetical protein
VIAKRRFDAGGVAQEASGPLAVRGVGLLGRRLVLFGLLVICGMAAVPASAGQNAVTGESTAKTDEAPLTGNGGNGIADVKYKCAETLSAKGEISVKCDFTNESAKTPKLFIVCMMLDLKKSKQKAVPGIKKQDKHDYVLSQIPTIQRS